ncbi:MAG: hypothetical protein AAFZ65_07205 [Planctomycetota bacterium]
MDTGPTFFSADQIADERGAAELLAVLDAEQAVGIRGLVEPARVRQALVRLAQRFTPADDTKTDLKSGASRPRDVPNYQRLMLGGHGEGDRNRTYFMRVFNNPAWADDLYGMRPVFASMARLRNRLQGSPDGYCVEAPEAEVYTLSRIHQFPRGGGFMGEHADSVAAEVPARASIRNYAQLLLVMSQRGEDFEVGGGYYVRDGRRVFYERWAEPGDVLVYNARTRHGVQAVDPHRPRDLGSTAGRYSGLVTLYRSRGAA